ncbi:MAG: rhodanese-like domain-containing protein [Pseudodesulfovibrio sp.]|nr:rhodanese-like domain-containing protein [Pseudodesulfovibrio sp.]
MRGLKILIGLIVILILWDVVWWFGFGVSPMSPWQLKQLVNQGRAPELIDVRTPGEFASFHIPGAVNVPYPATLAELAFVSPDPNRPILIICMSGHRSPPVAKQMQDGGYTNVHNLTWGMMAWKLFGGDTTSGH